MEVQRKAVTRRKRETDKETTGEESGMEAEQRGKRHKKEIETMEV